MKENTWSNLAQVVFRRTYSRSDTGRSESWEKTVERVIRGNIRGHEVGDPEVRRLEYFMLERKAMPAGRGLWFSGSPAHERLGGAALNNCWYLQGDSWRNLVVAQDLLMLGGGVGFSIESELVAQIPAVRKHVVIARTEPRPGAWAVPDSREGWCELISRVLEAFLETGRSFNYTTELLRPRGERILGFGGHTAGPDPLVQAVNKITALLDTRSGQHLRPLDVMDLLCIIGEMVVAGNVRRSAILILGDAQDADYLQAKRWDLHPLPPERAMANLSVVADSPAQLGELFWETYLHGEPFGIVHRGNLKRFGRMGERKHDDATGVNPCAEATLTPGEPCNLQEIFLPNLAHEAEFIEAARLMHRWGKRVTCEHYHLALSDQAVKKYRRVGTGITGCLQSPLFAADPLDRAYAAIQDENRSYSQALGIAESIRTTVIKPSGTLSLLGECLPGIHPAYSRYYIRRVRFAADDPILDRLKLAGHPVEPAQRLDGSLDPRTSVAEFYCEAPTGVPVADENWDAFKQMDVVRFAQKHWSDQAVSVTVYYRREDLVKIRDWLDEHFDEIKTMSFLAHSDHGFVQAPLEAISEAEYVRRQSRIGMLSLETVEPGSDADTEECEGHGCLVK